MGGRDYDPHLKRGAARMFRRPRQRGTGQQESLRERRREGLSPAEGIDGKGFERGDPVGLRCCSRSSGADLPRGSTAMPTDHSQVCVCRHPGWAQPRRTRPEDHGRPSGTPVGRAPGRTDHFPAVHPVTRATTALMFPGSTATAAGQSPQGEGVLHILGPSTRPVLRSPTRPSS